MKLILAAIGVGSLFIWQGMRSSSLSPKWLQSGSGYAYAYSPELAYIAKPPMPIFGDTESVGWSPDSKYLVSVIHDSGSGKVGFWTWNTTSRKTAQQLRNFDKIQTGEWIYGTRIMAVSTIEVLKHENRTEAILRECLLDVATGQLSVLFTSTVETPNQSSATSEGAAPAAVAFEEMETIPSASVDCSPVRGVYVLHIEDPAHDISTVQLFSPTGPLSAKISIPHNSYCYFKDSGTYLCRSYNSETKKNVSSIVDFASGNLQFIEATQQDQLIETPMTATQGKPTLALEDGPSEATFGGKATHRTSLWLTIANAPSRLSSMLTMNRASSRALSPDKKWLMYQAEGIVFVREVVKIEPAELIAAYRSKMLSDVKQIGLAAILYATDYDDEFAVGDFAEIVQPYLSNRECMDGFVLTFGGGNISKVESPAETEIGYKVVPGGRVVVYIDGHAKFVPDK